MNDDTTSSHWNEAQQMSVTRDGGPQWASYLCIDSIQQNQHKIKTAAHSRENGKSHNHVAVDIPQQRACDGRVHTDVSVRVVFSLHHER